MMADVAFSRCRTIVVFMVSCHGRRLLVETTSSSSLLDPGLEANAVGDELVDVDLWLTPSSTDTAIA